jgi:hypothetical protein
MHRSEGGKENKKREEESRVEDRRDKHWISGDGVEGTAQVRTPKITAQCIQVQGTFPAVTGPGVATASLVVDGGPLHE